MRERFTRTVRFLGDANPLREVEMFGPTVVNALVFMVASVGKSDESVGFCLFAHVVGLLVSAVCFHFMLRCKLTCLSLGQIVSVLSYSIAYFVPFGVLSRLCPYGGRALAFLKLIALLPALVLQVYVFILTTDLLRRKCPMLLCRVIQN